MALIAGATTVSMDGLRATDSYDTTPVSYITRQATFAEQVAVLGSVAEVKRVSLGALVAGHTAGISQVAGVFTLTVS